MPTFLPTTADMLANSVPATPPHGFLKGTTGEGPPDGDTAIASYLRDLQAVGGTISRTYLSANFINTSSGVFNWSYRQGGPDSWYTTMVAAGITPILQHIFAPTWWFTYTGWSPSATPYADWPPFPSAEWDSFIAHNVDFATAAAIRYPLAIIEISNEWNNGGIYVKPQGGQALAVTAANYAAYHAPIQAAYKAVNPTQKVIVGGLLRMDSANFSNWVAGNAIPALLKPALDALSCTPDGVSIHPYMLGAPTSNPVFDLGPNILSRTSWQSVGRYLDAQDAAGWHLPVYITETGFRASGTNAQNAFNCNSETTKAIWNRYEHDNMLALYTKDARPAGKSWVEAMMYYRWQEYPSPTATSKSGGYPGDPPEGPHTLNEWGQSLQDFITRVNQRNSIPRLDGLTLSNCPSTAVIGQAPVTITAAGVGTGCIPNFHSSDPTIVSVGAQTTGVASVALSFPGSGTVTVWADSYSAARNPVSVRQQIVVAPQIPTSSAITPGNGWQVATSNSGTIQFTVVVTDQIGNVIVSPTGTWTSSDPTNAPIDPVTGLLTAVGVATGVVVTYTPDSGTAPGRIATSTGNVLLNPVLQITNVPTQLINVGAVVLTVTDGASPVTGCTIVISDGAKATAVGQTMFGLGTSGTFTVKAQHAGYDDSSLVTVTCTGGGYLDDKDVQSWTNGQSVSTYTDAGGTTWAQATSTKQPTALTNDLNGHTSLVFDGVDDYLRASAAVATLNASSITYAALLYPTSATVAANEQWIDNRDTTNSQGIVLGRNAGTLAHVLDYYTAPSTLTQRFDGPAMAVNTWVRMIDRIAQGAQSRMLNGVVVGTSGADATYRNPTTNPPLTMKGGNISGNPGNNTATRAALEILVNRAVSDAERLQIDQRLQTYGAL